MEEQTQGFWKGFSWKRSVITVFLILVAAGAVGGTVWYVMDRNAKDTKEANDKSLQALEDRIDLMSKVTEKTPTEAKPAEATLVSFDSKYNLYTNPKTGFSMKVPKTSMNPFGSCSYVSSEKSYRSKEAVVPVTVITDSDRTYVTFNYTYELTGKTEVPSNGGVTYRYSGCRKVNASLLNINADFEDSGFYFQKWTIKSFDASTDAQVNDFLSTHYGKTCSIGERKATSQSGTYQLGIKGDGKDLGTTQCPVNFMVAIFYNQQKGKIIYWDMGQEVTFTSSYSASNGIQYQEIMLDSFKFL